MRLYSDILNSGVKTEMSSKDRKYTRLTNLVNLVVIFIISIPAMITICNLPAPNNAQPSLIRFELLIIGAILNLLFIRKGFYLLIKVQTVVLPFVLIFIFPLLNKFMHEGMLLWMPYGIISLGGLPFLIFSLKKEKWILISLTVLCGFTGILYDNIFTMISPDHLSLSLIDQNYVIYKVSITIICIILYSNLYLLKISNYQIQDELDMKNSLLLKMNDDLEEMVSVRTQKINTQNERIKELAFTNSHELRASVARIIGLANILRNSEQEEEKLFCIQKIEENIKEIDSITKALAVKLVEVE